MTTELYLRDCGHPNPLDAPHPHGPDQVSLDRLSPIARTLAEAVAASPLRTRAPVILESRLIRMQMRPDLAAGPWYTDEEMQARDTIVWCSWASYPCESTVDPHTVLEREARKLPLGYAPVRASVDEELPSAAAAHAWRHGDSGQVLRLLADLGRSVAASTWRSYVADRDTHGRPTAPQPACHVGRTPLWDLDEVTLWQRDRKAWRQKRCVVVAC
jgi:hypothetical protein